MAASASGVHLILPRRARHSKHFFAWSRTFLIVFLSLFEFGIKGSLLKPESFGDVLWPGLKSLPMMPTQRGSRKQSKTFSETQRQSKNNVWIAWLYSVKLSAFPMQKLPLQTEIRCRCRCMHLAITGCSLMGGRWLPSGYYHQQLLHAPIVTKVFKVDSVCQLARLLNLPCPNMLC